MKSNRSGSKREASKLDVNKDQYTPTVLNENNKNRRLQDTNLLKTRKMEHLDLAGVISNWNLPGFEQQDALYLSSSRQMLEPILEETSEDEEYAQNSWNQYENGTSFCSSTESETGSVIRIETNKDADSISERDFACPAKRARRSDEFVIGGATGNQPAPHHPQHGPNSLVDTVVLRKCQRTERDYEATNSLDRFLAYEATVARDSYGASSQQRSSTGSRRFDDFYSDSDSLSYQSLSRSSSLIQFESLERQLLEQHTSMNSLGNSSPSLLSFDGNGGDGGAQNGGSTGAVPGGSSRSSASNSGNNSRRGSQSSLLMSKRFENVSDGRLHQTYLGLDKLCFDDEDTMGGVALLRGSSSSGAIGISNASLMKSGLETTAAEIKSDSESSISSGNSILIPASKKSTCYDDDQMKTSRVAAFHRGGKNSAENLSEDSGYGEPSTLRRSKSKSIPKNFEKFCEEEEEFVTRRPDTSTTTATTEQENNEMHGGEEDDEEIIVVVADENIHSKISNTSRHYIDDENDEDDVYGDEYDEEDGSAEDDADHIDICRPKINNAVRNMPALPVASPLYELVINSPPRESSSPSPHRLMAHSPSPASSEGSSSSASCRTASSDSTSTSTTPSTCASAASFTWHTPTHARRAIEIEFEFGENELGNSESLGDFQPHLRNSLPDIRDAFRSSSVSNDRNQFLYSRKTREPESGGLESLNHSRRKSKPPVETSHPLTSLSSSSETTPTVGRKQYDAVDGSGGRRATGHQRAASVPNELNKLGKKKRFIRTKFRKALSDNDDLTDSSIFSGSSEEDDFSVIKRTTSWSERREITLQKHSQESQETPQSVHINDQTLPSSLPGYMNASYCDLTHLDYSGRKPAFVCQTQGNYKRCVSSAVKMSESRKSSGDYESLICKGNFLLDELSEIYDKNASILNDRSDQGDGIEMETAVTNLERKEKTPGPVPPPRHPRTAITTNCAKVEDDVQHVQLTIRKPPTRQKHKRDAGHTSSLIQEPGIAAFSTFGKTFDQDPTLMRTSYAQSLEKCNFDPKEISHTDLTKCGAAVSMPKRRFHSHAATTKKRNLVSSTPNLNAFDPRADDVEDDMYVSSAHTSMHALPQTTAPKPLGILLPAGSRSSFGKEVSFCPVVSKYCWQEQSSEECNEPPTPTENENADNDDDVDEADSDDELLDNADATVIYNTKENEMIAARYNAEQEKQQHTDVDAPTSTPSQEEGAVVVVREIEPVRALLVVREAPHKPAREKTSQLTAEQQLPAQSSVVQSNGASTAVIIKRTIVASGSNTVVPSSNIDNCSETPAKIAQHEHKPSTSNGNSIKIRPLSIQLPILSEPPTNRAHILYASQQMLDNFERHRDNYPEDYQSANSLNSATQPNVPKMSESFNGGGSGAAGQSAAVVLNNNNDKIKSKFNADEKHPSSKGFLSRFAGFRFSLRRNKKKHQMQQQQQQVVQPSKSEKPSKASKVAVANGKDKKSSPSKTVPKTADSVYIPLKGPLPENNNSMPNDSGLAIEDTSNASTASVHSGTPSMKLVVTGKPPLPKLPSPRQHVNATHALSGQHPHVDSNNTSTQTTPNSTHMFTTDFLDSERSYYMYDDFKNQLNAAMQANGVVGGGDAASAGAGNGAISAYVDKRPNNNDSNNCKIGLIETNLDTHETIITGKTRSLMNIGPKQLSIASGVAAGKHSTLANEHHHHHSRAPNGLDDDEDGVSDIRIKHSAQSGGAQIASVRRPHKSMEFLLDKENQKNVLPPENELQKSHDQNPAALSEHQLRVQASLQRLNIPDWFRQYNQNTARSPDGGVSGSKPSNFTRKRATESGRWAGLNSKTTSLSSLGSQRSDRSPLLLSPSAHSHHGCQTSGAAHPAVVGSSRHSGGHGAFSRWSTSHLNSSQTSPSVSQRGTFMRGGPVNSSFMSVASGTSSVIRNSYRQPYLGWRSTEKLSQRTPHERLATSLLAQQQRTSPTQATGTNGADKLQAVTPEIQSSIKEVTSAIVHYVNDQRNQQRSRSTSPNSRKCWLESSFVGVRALDSPQTPVIDSAPTPCGYANNTIYQNNTTAPRSITAIYSNQPSALSTFINAEVVRMNGRLSIGPRPAVAPELSSASLEDVLSSLLGLPTATTATSASASGGEASTTSVAYARTSTTGSSVSDLPIQQQQLTANNIYQRHMPQQVQPPQHKHPDQSPTSQQFLDISPAEQHRLRRHSEGDAPSKQNAQKQNAQQNSNNTDTVKPTNENATRRVSLGDSTTDPNCKNTSGELQIKCRNTRCEGTATPADAKKYYKSCHNCTHLYCSRECRRSHWEKHRKACLHSRASNLCRQVLATCKDDLDSQRHLSLLARKGFLSQGRGVVRVLFRSAESAEGFIKHGFQCMGEASYVRWPDLMPAEMGLELYSELLKLSTEYKPDSKMLIYVAICVVSEAPGMGQAPVRWERQLVSRCAKLKLCKTILAEMKHQHQSLQQQPVALVAIPEPTTEILILTFNPSMLRTSQAQRELILSNTLDILSRRGVFLRKHYPEIYQRLQAYTDGQTDKFNAVTLHPRDSQTGQSFVCIIMPVHSDTEIIKLPSITDGGNRVTTIDVGSPAALAQLDDDELLTRSTS